MDRKAFGKKVNKARKDLGLTSEKLSELCNLNATYIRQIEAGTKVPSLPVFVLLCKTLKVSPAYLLSEALEDCYDIQEMDALIELWQNATPSQIKMISAMVKSALSSFEQ